MASSRRSASRHERLTDTLIAAVREALRPLPADAALVLAYSGGLDSTVLLELLARVGRSGRLTAWHVHHGLQPAADDWPAFCAEQARRRGIAFGVTRIGDAPAAGDSIEAWARERRYEALWQAAAGHGAAALVTAHHADDQVETVLMRLARGAGPAALAGMRTAQRHPQGWLLRPLLGIERATLHEWAQREQLGWIEDPMNSDARLLRGALRTQVLPAWRAAMPGLTAGVLRSAELLHDALAAIEALGATDLQSLMKPAGIASEGFGAAAGREIDLRALASLPPFRRAEALRAWCRLLGAPLPSRAAIVEWLRQLVVNDGTGVGDVPVGVAAASVAGAAANAAAAHCAASHALKVHGGWRFRRYGVRLIAEPLALPDWLAQPPSALQLHWRGESELPLPGWGGRLLIRTALEQGGVDARWLASRRLQVSPPRSSARLRLRAQGPSRTLKNLFQERRVPPWLRAGLPMVCDAVSGRLLYVGGLGMDRTPSEGAADRGDEMPRGAAAGAPMSESSTALRLPTAGLRVELHWQPDAIDDPRGNG
ncbi:MAG: tRNA lysidine(34) synthetase TilS [Burkholderiales bacterium]|nr:tRNA lysidine(34) synthetase TilS [Burkholderiales bacterium]